MKNPALFNESNEATYCPEDDKLRLYVGRVPKEEYLALRAEGWTSTPKQSCDFVAVWSIKREDTALSYAGEIGDEDQSPEERAADRAERFAMYRDKRTTEAMELADRFESLPTVHGYQNEQKAERAAARHARIGVNACSQWDKAEYWQRRTAGVISHALYRSRPSVRMGRIKEIESDMRRAIAAYTPAPDAMRSNDVPFYCPVCRGVMCEEHPEAKIPVPMVYCGISHGWQVVSRLPAIKEAYSRFVRHCELRLQYENAMLEAVGGMAGELEIKVGGRFGGRLIYKVNKSNVTGRVTTIAYATQTQPPYTYRVSPSGWYFPSINTEKSTAEAYTPPTPEDIALVEQIKKEVKAATKTESIPLINPTMESAKIAQAHLNEVNRKWYADEGDREPIEMTQAACSARMGHVVETVYIGKDGKETHKQYYGNTKEGAVCKIRIFKSRGHRVVIITDKPQKALPIEVGEEVGEEVEA